MKIDWLHAPGHQGSIKGNVIEFAASHNALVIDWSEMYNDTDLLAEHAHRYVHFAGKPRRRDSHNRVVNHDVVVSVHKNAKILHAQEFFVAAEVTRLLKYNPERWGKAVVFEYEGVIVLLVAWHPHPGPFNNTKLVLPKYRKSVRRATRVQRRLEALFNPDVVLNGGDLQLRKGVQRVSPNQLAKRLHMKYVQHKIDWQMWRGEDFEAFDHKIIDPSKINKGMDHLWMLLSLVTKRRSA